MGQKIAMQEQEIDDEHDVAILHAIAERLKVAVRSSGGNKEIARVSGVPLRTLNSYMAAEADPKLTKIGRIATACGTTVDALMGIKPPSGVPFSVETLGPSRTTYGIVDDGLTTQGREGGRTRHGTPEGFTAVPFLAARTPPSHDPVSPPGDDGAPTYFLFSTDWLQSVGVSGHDVELRQAQGDSMEPTIQDGDLMLVDRGAGEIVHGKIYALVVDDLVVVKRVNVLAIGGMILISDNDRYPSETVRREDVGRLNFQGRVAWYGRAI